MNEKRFAELVMMALDADTMEDALNGLEVMLFSESDRDMISFPHLADAESERAGIIHDALNEIGYYKKF